jgi:hypothetical protein
VRLDGVEVKITFPGAEMACALETLQLADSSRRRIWFFDDLTPGVKPFLDGHTRRTCALALVAAAAREDPRYALSQRRRRRTSETRACCLNLAGERQSECCRPSSP